MQYIYKHIFLLLILIGVLQLTNAQQQGFYLKDKVSYKINFELISNLIIIPVEVNGIELSFVLDSGVSKPILFNLTEKDSLSLKNTETFYLYGLGSKGKLEALRSKHNIIKVGNATKVNQNIYVVYDEDISFSPRLGMVIHGIIGYDIFKDFIVEINYSAQFIRLHKPEHFKAKTSKKWKQIPLEFHQNKAYLNTKITLENNTLHDVKLLIDTGSSDALWLFENKEKGITPNKNLYFTDYLGRGLSGSVYGKRSKIKTLQIGDFKLSQPNVAFPDSLSIDTSKLYKSRNGSLGGDVLKRFNLFFNYQDEVLYLKKNGLFKQEFTYNNSGIVLEYNGTRFIKEEIKVPDNNGLTNENSNNAVKINFAIAYRFALKPTYIIVELRPTSNAYLSGVRVDDVLVSINGKYAHSYSLPELNSILHGKTGKTIKLKVERNGVEIPFKFKLDSPFNTE